MSPLATRRSAAFVLASLFLFAGTLLAEPVRIDSGLIEGEVLDAVSGLRVYRGIPYAAPPVGELRWRAPEPPPSWEGVRAAKTFGAICPQPPLLAAMMGVALPDSGEDCLFLNVWTAAPSPDSRLPVKLPVMVWIHGGGLTMGWSQQSVYDGAALASRGVVLVSINYRLGPLGFLSLPELSRESSGGGSGNYGFLDQVAALRWVQRNIAAFGGDPANVTIFGESAGGTSVYTLLAAAGTEGLFHRAIAESPWITESNIAPLEEATPFGASAEATGEQWAARIVGEGGDTSLTALRQIPASQIIAKTGASFRALIAIDGKFMTEHSERAFREGSPRKVPVIAGTNADEGTMFANMLGYANADAYRKGLRETYGDHADAVFALYPTAAEGKLADTLNRYLTDAWFLRATRGMLLGMAKIGAPAYQYHFTRRNRARPEWGAHHAAELGYVFNNPGGIGGPAVEWDEIDRQLGDAMIRYWVQFAKTGDPNADGLPQWPRFDAATESYLEFGDQIRHGSNLCAERCAELERVLAALRSREDSTGGR
jgi:para-nitrobenzyl esterase